jgi:hypothetical protein
MGTSAMCRRSVIEFSGGNGAPEEIRTPDPQIRSLVLYPAELPALIPAALFGCRRICVLNSPAQPHSSHCESIGSLLRATLSVLQYLKNSLTRQAATLDAMSFVDTVLTRLNSCTTQKMTTPPSL